MQCSVNAMKIQQLHLFSFLLLLFFINFSSLADELSRCCAGGSRHFREHGNCQSVRAVGSSPTCSRAGSICCLRAVIDSSCQAGLVYAQRHKLCATVIINELAGGIKRECCDCCLLAKELTTRGEQCIAPTGFSPDCLNSFNKCCNQTSNIRGGGSSSRMPSNIGAKTASHVQSIAVPIAIDNEDASGSDDASSSDGGAEGCDNTKCEHLCSIREDGTPQCSCRSGFDLGPDGRACVDMDECADYGAALCSEFNTQCLNLEGSFSCVCSPGFYWSDGGNVCVDIDECLLLVDDCLESQRCLNTPGAYKCIRTQACGTGYAMDSETEQCVDVDECTLGAHDCGPMYQCKNTQGSFRCFPKKCPTDDQVLDPATGECKSMNCPAGYQAKEGRCEDIDECKAQPRKCAVYEECVNTPGGFRCQEQGNVCSSGYYMDKESGFCLDIDECLRGTHNCRINGGECINLPGTFRCNCPTGFEFNEFTLNCEDVDECVKFAGHACSLQADCINSIGSFHCLCKSGFKLAADNRSCDDIDECALGIARCQQKCINSPGSYQCICDRGYQLGLDENTCEDIDECAIWSKSGNELCMGKCINTPGSFLCTCPIGYQIMEDGITCKDVDECGGRQPNLCPSEQLCINLLGSYRCQRIECPRNYLPDSQYKNRCVKRPGFCESFIVERCKNWPVHISWQHIAIPKQINISSHRTSVTLFSMKGPVNPNSTMQFELGLISARPDFPTVIPAVRANFLLQKGEDHNSATIGLRDSLDGPQEIHLELVLRLTTNGIFNGKYLANLMVYVSQYRPQAQQNHSLFAHRHRQRRRNMLLGMD